MQVRQARMRSVGIIPLTSVLIFVASVGGGAYVYVKENLLKKNIEEYQKQVAAVEAEFQRATIAELSRVSNRLDVADRILHTHISASAIFELLGEQTVETVRFVDFSYTFGQQDVVTLTMRGEGASYNSVALQSDIISTNRNFQEPIFSGLSLNDKGRVAFNFSAKLKPEFISYARTRAAPVDATPVPLPGSEGEFLNVQNE